MLPFGASEARSERPRSPKRWRWRELLEGRDGDQNSGLIATDGVHLPWRARPGFEWVRRCLAAREKYEHAWAQRPRSLFDAIADSASAP